MKKQMVQKFGKLLLPILYCEIVLQGRLENSGKLYCNTLECIAIEEAGLAKKLYRDTV